MASMIPVPADTGISDRVLTENVGRRLPELPQLIGPNITVTPPTDTTPGGKIFEDVVRRTIFWEAADITDDVQERSNEDDSVCWGNIFRVEWIKW